MLHCEANSYFIQKSLISGHHFNNLPSFTAYESGKIVSTTPAERQG